LLFSASRFLQAWGEAAQLGSKIQTGVIAGQSPLVNGERNATTSKNILSIFALPEI
jgi:hypothetical protein